MAGWRGERYKKISINKRSYTVHRLVYLYHKGYLPKELDHIDGNKNNNRIENLRAASKYQNKWNSKKHKDNKSGLKSVIKRGKVYEVCIFARHKRYYIGRFKTKKDASIAVTRAREDIHGRFARVN